jgi:sporulation protein YlmC with PRC-barrel domain
MRTSLLAATAALALVAAPVLAQTPSPGSTTAPRPPSSMPGATGQTAAPRAPMPNPLTQEDLSRVKGTDVYGTDGKKLGSVDTVLMNPQTKSIERLVVKSGGVLGVGGHDVAIPVDQFSWDSTKEGFKLAKTNDELKNMPAWKAASVGSSAGSSVGGGTSSGASGTSGSTGTGAGTTTPTRR